MSAFPIAYPRTIPICSTRCSLITITFVVQCVQKPRKQRPIRVCIIHIGRTRPVVGVFLVVYTHFVVFYLPHELRVKIRYCAVSIVRVTQLWAVASSVTREVFWSSR